MSEREKIIRYYRSSGDAELAAKLIDLADNALRSRKYRVSEFLDPYGYSVAETMLPIIRDLLYRARVDITEQKGYVSFLPSLIFPAG